KSLEDLISNIDTIHLIFSYNDERIIKYDDLLMLFEKYSIDCNVKVVKIPYRKYKSKLTSEKIELYEYIFYIQKKEFNDLKEEDKFSTKKVSKWQPNKEKYIKSPLNYVGGKYKLLNQIILLFPSNISKFVDLFSGGANVGINISANKHVFIDMNSKINEMFRYFAEQDSEELITRIQTRINEYELSKTNEQGYKIFREQYNNNPNPLDLYVLISFSYNYQIRFNKNMKNNLIDFTNRLHNMNYSFQDSYFQDVDLSNLDEDSLVYLDPPYLITTGSYNDGNRGFQNWGIKQEQEMYSLMKNLSER